MVALSYCYAMFFFYCPSSAEASVMQHIESPCLGAVPRRIHTGGRGFGVICPASEAVGAGQHAAADSAVAYTTPAAWDVVQDTQPPRVWCGNKICLVVAACR